MQIQRLPAPRRQEAGRVIEGREFRGCVKFFEQTKRMGRWDLKVPAGLQNISKPRPKEPTAMAKQGAVSKDTKYKWVYGPDGKTLWSVGILSDGTLHNPNGYPDDVVRDAVLAANARWHERRRDAAKKAAVTRQRRQLRRVNETAQKIVTGHNIGPRSNCAICGRGLGDTESISRGIGSECWQGVLQRIEQVKARTEPRGEHWKATWEREYAGPYATK
jgi:hypothetical protein